MVDIAKILDFVDITNYFKKIKRDIPSSEGVSPESDADHSYQLAMVCWYIAGLEGNNFDTDKILRYALVHDLAEVYAGDTPLYTANETLLKNKKTQEQKAILKLKEEFPAFTDLHVWIENYQNKVDDESRFVFAIDKILPIMSIYLDQGYAWKTHDIDLDLLVNKNKERVAVSPIATKYFDAILEIIKEDPELFNRKLKIFKGAISHDGQRCDVHHIDADNFDEIPDELKIKAHAVCLHNGKMVLVNHAEWDIWSIPGGTRDEGESIEETLHREVLEETNCAVTDSAPIAYQKIITPSGKVCHYRLIYMCNVTPKGDFKEDPSGQVGKIAWVEPNEFEDHIENKEFKKVIFRRVLDLKENENRKN